MLEVPKKSSFHEACEACAKLPPKLLFQAMAQLINKYVKDNYALEEEGSISRSELQTAFTVKGFSEEYADQLNLDSDMQECVEQFLSNGYVKRFTQFPITLDK